MLWTAHGAGYAFSFTDRGTFLCRRPNRKADVSRVEPVASGSDRSGSGFYQLLCGQKDVSVPGYRRLRRAGVYPGIDVVYYGNGRKLEYDFEVAPGSDPSKIRMRSRARIPSILMRPEGSSSHSVAGK